MISVAISTYNRLSYLRDCIASLLALAPLPDEIIVVNDGSTDGTRQYLNHLAKTNPRIRVFHHEGNRGLSAGRNTAIKHARGEIIAFTDDDCIADPHWLRELVAPFHDQAVVAAYGQVFYRAENYRGYFPERLVRNIGPAWPMGANIAYRASIFRKVGLFDLKFFRYNNEDSEMAFRLARVGTLVRTPSAIVYHQAMNWTCKSLLRAARNASVWPILYARYGTDIFRQNFKPPIRFRRIVNAEDYLYFFLLPMMLPVLLVRYLYHGKRDLRIFFCKWPLYLILRRLYIWYESFRNRVFMI